MDFFEKTCLGIVTVCAGILLIEGTVFVFDVRRDVNTFSGNLNKLAVTVNETTVEARDAATQAKLAAVEQRAYWAKTSLETYKTMASLRLTIVRTDHSMNDVLVPELSTTLDATNKLSTTAATELGKTMDQLQPILLNLGQASAGAAITMNDPAIHETLAHTDDAAAHAAVVADETAQTAAHLNAASADFAAYVHRMTAPARGVWNALKTLLGLAAQARQASGI